MLLIECLISERGNEITLKSDVGEIFRISAADARRLELNDPDSYPREFDDTEYLSFLCQKLKAVKYCQYLLNFSDKSYSVLLQKLREKQYSPEVCSEAIRVLKDSGVCDEGRICKSKLNSLAAKLYGPFRIRSELMSKGFSRQDIDNAFETTVIDFDGQCLKLIKKRTDGTDIQSPYDEKMQKIKAKLARYGYGADSIRHAVNAYFEEYH